MINESNRNTRTLILSFVVAVMALIPLRFIEVGQQLGDLQQAKVLGVSQEITLPNAEVTKPVLEAPYNAIDGSKPTPTVESAVAASESGCVSKEGAVSLTATLKAKIESGKLTKAKLDEAISQLLAVQTNTCK